MRISARAQRPFVPVTRNVTLPPIRGMAFGIYSLSDDVGKGLGPAVVSMLIASRGRESAFCLTINFWIVCGSLLLLMAATYERDERKVTEPLCSVRCPPGLLVL